MASSTVARSTTDSRAVMLVIGRFQTPQGRAAVVNNSMPAGAFDTPKYCESHHESAQGPLALHAAYAERVPVGAVSSTGMCGSVSYLGQSTS